VVKGTFFSAATSQSNCYHLLKSCVQAALSPDLMPN
jgi:hypothetical protein